MGDTEIVLESEVVDWLIKLIETEQLIDAIKGKDGFRKISDATRQNDFIETFSIDSLSRLASAAAADHVLGNLNTLNLITVNKSISITAGQVLRPDILCFNPERKTLIVFEVKRATDTERQTVTELAGYEQELRNMLPFLGNFEICFVVVAKDWSTLLDHAVGNMNAWSGKQCLALKVDISTDPFQLSCHLPDAWHMTGSFGLPPEALHAIDVYLVEEESDTSEDWPPRCVMTAMDIIARAGDRAGSHGFMMLWKDVNGMGRGRWSLTLCAIDPLEMYAWCRKNGLPQRESETSSFLDEQAATIPGMIPSIVFRIAREAFPILADRFDPEFDGAYTWHDKLQQYRSRGVPLRFDFWGKPGEYAREFVCNPAVRDRYMPYIRNNELDWTDPEVAVPLIENLSGRSPFAGGVIRCSDAFSVGLTLGTLANVAFNAARSEEASVKLEPLVRWAEIEALRFSIEMKQIYDTANEVTAPMPTLSSNPELRLQAAKDLMAWVMNDLIGELYPLHQACFALGCDGTMLFSTWMEGGESVLTHERKEDLISRSRKILCDACLYAKSRTQFHESMEWTQLNQLISPYVTVIDPSDVSTTLKEFSKLPNEILQKHFTTILLPGIDTIIPFVLHTVAPLPAFNIDWELLKKSAKAIFDAGYLWPTVVVTQDGTIGTGYLQDQITKILPPIVDPELEVYFSNESSSFNMATKMTWPELIKKGIT
jgi:hypothetical protein